MTATESREVVRMILSGWPAQRQRMSAEDTQGMALFYAAGLEDIDVAAARAAIIRLARTSEWMPTVAAIRAAAITNELGARRAGAEAWGEVLAAMRTKGSHRYPGVDFWFDDAVTQRVVRALGWADLCASDNSVADRARFIEAYDQITKTERTEAQASPGVSTARLLPSSPVVGPAPQIPPRLSDSERVEIAEMIQRLAGKNAGDENE